MSKIKIGLLSIVVISSIAFGATDCSHCTNLPTGQDTGQDSECLNKCYAQSSSSGTSASSSRTTTNTATSTNGSVNGLIQGATKAVNQITDTINYVNRIIGQLDKYKNSVTKKLYNQGLNLANAFLPNGNASEMLNMLGVDPSKLNLKNLKVDASTAFCNLNDFIDKIDKGKNVLNTLKNSKNEAEQFLKANFSGFNKNNKQSWDVANLLDKAMGCKDQANTKEIDVIAKAKVEILEKYKEGRKKIKELTAYGDIAMKDFLNFSLNNGYVEINKDTRLENIIKEIDKKLSKENIAKEQAAKTKLTKNGGFLSENEVVKAKADFTQIHVEKQKLARENCKAKQESNHVDYENCIQLTIQKLNQQCFKSGDDTSSGNGGGGSSPYIPNNYPSNPTNKEEKPTYFTDISTTGSGKCAGYFIKSKNESDRQKSILTTFATNAMKDVKTSEEIELMPLTDSDKFIEKQKSMQKLKEAEKQLVMMNFLFDMIDEVNNLQLTHAFVSAEPFDDAFSREKIDAIVTQATNAANEMLEAINGINGGNK